MLSRVDALEEPLHGRTQCVCAGFVVQLNSDRYQGAAFGGKAGFELAQVRRGRVGGGRDRPVGRLAKFGLNAADDGDDTRAGAEMPKQELATRGFGEREQRAGVNGAEMIEILSARRKAKVLRRIGCGLDAEELVEGEFGDTVFHAAGWDARYMLDQWSASRGNPFRVRTSFEMHFLG